MAITTPSLIEGFKNGFGGANQTSFSLDNVFKDINPTGNFSVSSGFASKLYSFPTYNGLDYKTEMYLDNSGNFDGNSKFRASINPAAVLHLSINDSVNDWVAGGSITFLYLPTNVSRDEIKKLGQSKATITGAKDNAASLEGFQFRGDGYDLLRIMVAPKATQSGPDAVVIKDGDPKWYLTYLFSIHNAEDVTDVPGIEPGSPLKCLKLYFHDARYQILKSTTLEYSTANSPNASYDSQYASVDSANQTGGVLNTGSAILEVLTQALGNPETGGSLEFGAMLFNDKNWDRGSSKIFYTSPTESTALDDIDYLYDHHVSGKQLEDEIYDLGLLHTTKSSRPEDLEQISLTPLSNFFENAGKEASVPGNLQLEHFFTSFTSDETNNIKEFKAPISSTTNELDLKTVKYGQILSYNFLDMSADTNSEIFSTKPVYSVDINNRQFLVDFENNNILKARSLFAKHYIKHLYKAGSNDENLFLPTLHKTKKTSRNISPCYSLHGDNEIVRQRKGILDLIYTGLFLNACICFSTLGLTLRKAGTFIGIDRSDGSDDDDYENKLYGQWFVVKVDHVFESASYINKIYAVKIHRHRNRKAVFNDTV